MKRVLILDDDPLVLRMLSRTLELDGLEILTCRELEAAEILMEHHDVDLVISDLCVSPFGDLEGGRLLGHLASQYPETRLIAISSTVNDRVRALLLGVGCATVVQKPLQPDMLRRMVLETLGPLEGTSPGRVRAFEPIDDFLARTAIHAALQPIVRLKPARAPWRVEGVECLARAPSDSPYSNPEILFAYASRKDRVLQADLRCIEAGLAEAGRFGGDGKVFLNVVPRSMGAPSFASRVEDLVAASGFAASRIVFEITEQQTILNPKALASSLGRLKKTGFELAIDDYGEGFSNLQLVLDLQPAYLKLSRVFTRGLESDERRRTVVASTAQMASRLNMITILEGVETAVEAGLARSLGVDCAQGYHIARPVRAEELALAFPRTVPASL
jgi:EAL domain-containing protein (putative c-di-GMP-specific phosphodiesterase class I)/ActR/RegA family two-component response regulator